MWSWLWVVYVMLAGLLAPSLPPRAPSCDGAQQWHQSEVIAPGLATSASVRLDYFSPDAFSPCLVRGAFSGYSAVILSIARYDRLSGGEGGDIIQLGLSRSAAGSEFFYTADNTGGSSVQLPGATPVAGRSYVFSIALDRHRRVWLLRIDESGGRSWAVTAPAHWMSGRSAWIMGETYDRSRLGRSIIADFRMNGIWPVVNCRTLDVRATASGYAVRSDDSMTCVASSLLPGVWTTDTR